MLTYPKLFQNAWQITWRNPRLWLLGVLVFLLTRLAQSFVLVFINGLLNGGIFSLRFDQLISLILVDPVSFAIAEAILFLVALLVLLFGWFAIIAQVALVHEVLNAAQGKHSTFGELVGFGVRKSWAILWLYAVAAIVYSAVLVPFSALAGIAYVQFLAGIFGAFILFPFLLISFFILKYTVCHVVLRDRSIDVSIQSAVALFRRNWLVTIEIGVLLFTLFWALAYIVDFGIGLLIIGALSLPDKPWLLDIADTLINIIGLCVGVLLTVFSWSVWVLVFEMITSPKTVLVSALKRLAGKG